MTKGTSAIVGGVLIVILTLASLTFVTLYTTTQVHQIELARARVEKEMKSLMLSSCLLSAWYFNSTSNSTIVSYYSRCSEPVKVNALVIVTSSGTPLIVTKKNIDVLTASGTINVNFVGALNTSDALFIIPPNSFVTIEIRNSTPIQRVFTATQLGTEAVTSSTIAVPSFYGTPQQLLALASQPELVASLAADIVLRQLATGYPQLISFAYGGPIRAIQLYAQTSFLSMYLGKQYSHMDICRYNSSAYLAVLFNNKTNELALAWLYTNNKIIYVRDMLIKRFALPFPNYQEAHSIRAVIKVRIRVGSLSVRTLPYYPFLIRLNLTRYSSILRSGLSNIDVIDGSGHRLPFYVIYENLDDVWLYVKITNVSANHEYIVYVIIGDDVRHPQYDPHRDVGLYRGPKWFDYQRITIKPYTIPESYYARVWIPSLTDLTNYVWYDAGRDAFDGFGYPMVCINCETRSPSDRWGILRPGTIHGVPGESSNPAHLDRWAEVARYTAYSNVLHAFTFMPAAPILTIVVMPSEAVLTLYGTIPSYSIRIGGNLGSDGSTDGPYTYRVDVVGGSIRFYMTNDDNHRTCCDPMIWYIGIAGEPNEQRRFWITRRGDNVYYGFEGVVRPVTIMLGVADLRADGLSLWLQRYIDWTLPPFILTGGYSYEITYGDIGLLLPVEIIDVLTDCENIYFIAFNNTLGTTSVLALNISTLISGTEEVVNPTFRHIFRVEIVNVNTIRSVILRNIGTIAIGFFNGTDAEIVALKASDTGFTEVLHTIVRNALPILLENNDSISILRYTPTAEYSTLVLFNFSIAATYTTSVTNITIYMVNNTRTISDLVDLILNASIAYGDDGNNRISLYIPSRHMVLVIQLSGDTLRVVSYSVDTILDQFVLSRISDLDLVDGWIFALADKNTFIFEERVLS